MAVLKFQYNFFIFITDKFFMRNSVCRKVEYLLGICKNYLSIYFLPTTYYQFVKCLLIKINQIVCQIKILNLQIIEIRLTLLSSITTLLFLGGWGGMTPRNNMSALRLYHYCGLGGGGGGGGGVTPRNNMLVLRLCQI